jgi:hypothetical protein
VEYNLREFWQFFCPHLLFRVLYQRLKVGAEDSWFGSEDGLWMKTTDDFLCGLFGLQLVWQVLLEKVVR